MLTNIKLLFNWDRHTTKVVVLWLLIIGANACALYCTKYILDYGIESQLNTIRGTLAIMAFISLMILLLLWMYFIWKLLLIEDAHHQERTLLQLKAKEKK